MRIVLASIFVLAVGATVGSAQAQNAARSGPGGRWCSVGVTDNVRHCYFKRHRDCMKAISDGSGVCVPSERNRGELPEDSRK